MFTCILNSILKRTKLMATITEILVGLEGVNSGIAAIDAKLDEVKVFIDSLKGSVVTQEQLDQIAALVDSAKQATDKVLSETDALDG
jgi:hypothetical protein